MDAIAVLQTLPPPADIVRRIESCRQEIAALKQLLRASQAASAAEEARKRRAGLKCWRPATDNTTEEG